MINKIIIASILIPVSLIFSLGILTAQETQNLNNDSIHIRNGYVPWGSSSFFKEYVFNNTDVKTDYFYRFPVEKFNQMVTKDVTDILQIDYRTYTSVEAAELAMVELLEMSALGMDNIIDVPLPNGKIGDNCWHYLHYGVVIFIRNNVFFKIGAKHSNIPNIDETAEMLARKADSLIIESEKIMDFNLLFAPEINSSKITSELPKKWEDQVKFIINATDPNSQQLSYRRYSDGLSIISKTGEISSTIYKSLDGTEDSTVAKVKVWVWNENNVYTLHYQKIPF